ncbi:hypothetical protein ACFFP0_21170 [Rhizobium puerariae]|uniref:Uncharacterized protein n=1 Tax=Rhizobium puerariae TaxID=1585791 RepID=A0ABV6AND1_9HYPH
MQEFIARKNIERFRSMLETDENRRSTIEQLIEREERALETIKSKVKPDQD